VVLFVGDDWAEDHHDVGLVDETGRRLARARLPEGVEGITRLHALIASRSANGAPCSPTPAWSRRSSTTSPSTPHILETGTESYRLRTSKNSSRPKRAS
jgi:hypothetical protein